MKIAIVTPTFPPYAGGIGNVAAANAATLVQLGHQVTVFTPLYQPVAEVDAGLSVRRIKPLFKYGNSAVLPGLGKLLAGFDIIHLHYPFFGTAEIVWLKAKKLKAKSSKLILHYHMDVVGSGIMKIIFSLHTKLLLPKIIKTADRVVVTSLDYGRASNIAGLIEKTPEKFIEVPNGVDPKKFFPGQKNSELLKQYEISPDEKVVLFVGGLDKAHYFKGVEYLIEAMSRLKQAAYRWKIVIVGSGELQPEYRDFADQLAIGRKTIFVGQVGAELPQYYQLADVVVLPSVDKSEAFGLVLVEAMACGKPVIASNLAGVRRVVDNGKNGLLVEPKNIDDLATKINHVLANPTIAAEFGRVGRAKVEAQYGWNRIGLQLDQLYKSLSSGHG